jgi:hypothetical protein
MGNERGEIGRVVAFLSVCEKNATMSARTPPSRPSPPVNTASCRRASFIPLAFPQPVLHVESRPAVCTAFIAVFMRSGTAA